jgi:hypothetical protein
MVEEQLNRLYSGMVVNGNLEIFCVSNTEYNDSRGEEYTIARPRIELSGIPALRQYCHLIPAKTQFEAVSAYLEHQVPSLLSSIRQWLLLGSEGLSAERANKLRKALESSRSQLLEVWVSTPTLK